MSTTDPQNDDFIFERVKERYEFENERFLGMENKASSLIGWSGLFLSILIAGGSTLFLNTTDTLKISENESYLLAATLIMLVISMGMSLFAYRIGTYNVVPNPKVLIEDYGTEPKKDTLSTVATEMAKAIERNSSIIDSKANLISISWALLLAGMIASVIFIILQVSKIVS